MPKTPKASKAAAAMPAIVLPPYGFIDTLLTEAIVRQSVPDNFQVAGAPGTRAQWNSVLDGIIASVADNLWPKFEAGNWVGQAAATMVDLTRADLKLCVDLAKELPKAPVIDREGNVDVLARSTQLKMFQDEETMRPPLYSTLAYYLEDVPSADLDALRDAMTKGIRAFGSQPLKLKLASQRPRPYQAALMLGYPAFNYEPAGSAMTPALPSGHCMQGLFAATSAYLAHSRSLKTHPRAIERLQRYAVAPGDRRVMGGVHYPSDNLASFYFDLRMCDHLFGEAGRAAKKFMCDAIEISETFVRMGKVDTYAPMIAWLRAEMNRWEPDESLAKPA